LALVAGLSRTSASGQATNFPRRRYSLGSGQSEG
jgi:hypothetical protein